MKLPTIPLPSTTTLVAIATLAGVVAGWQVQGWRMGGKLSDLRLEASGKALEAAIEAKAKTDSMRQQAAELDAKKTKELNYAKAETERMRARVASGTGWLQLNANCAKLPGLTLDPGLGNGAAPRLTDAAERNYFLLRDRAALCVKQVEYLQGYARIVQGQGAAPAE